MRATSQRTQIILSKDLREQIDSMRRKTGESLGEYLRGAVRERVEKEQKKKTDLKKLAERVIGSAKRGKGGWGDVEDSYTYIRKMRQEDDEHWLQRMEEARSSISHKSSSVMTLGDKSKK